MQLSTMLHRRVIASSVKTTLLLMRSRICTTFVGNEAGMPSLRSRARWVLCMTARVCTYLSSGVRSGLNRSHELATYLIVIDIVIVIVIMNVIVHRVCWWSPVHCLAVFWWLCHWAVPVVPYVVVVVVGPYARCPFLEPAGRAAGMARVPTRVRAGCGCQCSSCTCWMVMNRSLRLQYLAVFCPAET